MKLVTAGEIEAPSSRDEDALSARGTRAYIDIGGLRKNVQVFRNLIGQQVKLMAVVKANGYGHGAVMVARTAVAAGADYLAVATVDEGVQLRRSGLEAPILVLGPTVIPELRNALKHDLELAVGNQESISAVSSASNELGIQAKVHLKIDTGMRRFGCNVAEAPILARQIAGLGNLHLAGTFTHFACADETDESVTLDQQAKFESVLDAFDVEPGLRHAANSAATLRSRRYDYDMVRIGISLYGIAPSSDISLADGLRPILSIRSKIGRVFDLAPGDKVSYGGTYVATRHERAALIPIGYADGYRRGFSNKAWMSLSGVRCPVLGRVCMDQTVVGLDPTSNAREGDEVIVAGSPDAPSLDDLAAIVDTIPYEIATGIARRVPRFYVDGRNLVAIEDLQGHHETT